MSILLSLKYDIVSTLLFINKKGLAEARRERSMLANLNIL